MSETENSDRERWEPAFQCPSCGAEMRPRGRCQNQDCRNWQYTEIQRTESGVLYRFDGGDSAITDGGSEEVEQLKRARKRLSKFAERIRRNNRDLDTDS